MDATDYLRFVFAFIFVMSLMGLLAYVLRRYGKGRFNVARNNRLSVIEVRAIDARHRLALVKCDEAEHLLVLGPDNQIVVQSNIKSGATPS